MAYVRPLIETIAARIKGDISSRTKGSAFVTASIEFVLSWVLSGVSNEQHAHFEWLREQLLPTTCELPGLLAWGWMLKIPRLGATKAAGPAAGTGTNGTLLPAGTVLQSPDGTAYATQEDSTVALGVVAVNVKASVAGIAGNLSVGAKLTLVVPVAGIDTDSFVVGDDDDEPVTGGTDIEDKEAYRVRIVDGLRRPPSGGGPGDFVAWAKATPGLGVTRAWEFANRMGVGTVALGFLIDARPDPFPLTDDVAAVQAYVDSVRPIQMQPDGFTAAAFNKVPVAMTIALRPNTSSVRTQVLAELAEFFKTGVAPEVPAVQSQIDDAISTAQGENAHLITSLSSLDPGDWGLLTLGAVTFTTLA